ncbi:kelch domain-containing protein [Microdochium trichocladiopsis]|uniref:Kelch domain-containing protein n=1 Tax=Microdochium trichocladiopsis TaxID=1682393 RepID=A0A9P8Y6L6_9PEZI|nr:kelch domain-containing protein [Microdochium trichocladiopsis]KAH7030653.1 kelch domain-containing protein [Microdochium trichocladiopsis]
MWQIKAAAAALLLAQPTLCQLSRCPSGEARLGTPSGALYAVCEEADFRGSTVQSLDTVATLADCAQACERRPGCTRAVYDKTKSECHLKSSCGMSLIAAEPQFTTIKWLHTFEAGEEIGSCVATARNITSADGSVLATCSSADFSGSTRETIDGVASLDACASECGRSASCLRAVYHQQASQCLLKDDSAELQWTFQPGYDTVQKISPPSGPAPVPTPPADPVATLGRWSEPIKFPIIPVAAYMVPSGPVATKILMFSSWGATDFGGAGGKTQFASYDMSTGAVSERTVVNTHHDMFCPGISALGDGKIVISGGSDAAAVSIYDPATDAFTKAPDMVVARGYQSSATLSDGRVFTIGGSYSGGKGGKTGEVYDPVQNKWTLLPGTDPKPILTTDHEGIWREDNHAWLFGWRNGSVFQAGPSKAMNWYLTDDEGSHVPAGTREAEMDQMCGINVMYDVGKILSAGGSQDYTDSAASSQAHVIEIGNVGEEATAITTANMHFARGFANAVVLPDGQVIVTGGQKKSLVFTDTDSVLIPEIWSEKTNAWAQLAPAAIPRNYHSVSLLLPDGTVFVGGGGMCYGQKNCDRAKDHLDGEIFTPPYLFARDGTPAARPVVKSVSAAEATVGTTLAVDLEGDAEGVSFVFVRMGSSTHSINSDQRRVPLTQTQQTGPGAYSVTIPNDSGVVLPGPWYLFAMSKDGVPSIARTVMITPS